MTPGPLRNLRSPLHSIFATSEAFPDPSSQCWTQLPLSLGQDPLWQVLGQRLSLPAGPRPSIPAASPLRGPNRPQEGATARGTPAQPGASYLGQQSESPGGHSWPAPSPDGAAALPAVCAVWPRSGPLLSVLYKILIIKKARKKKESLHSPTPKSIFQGGGAEGFVRRATQTPARGQRGAPPGRGSRARARGQAQAGGAGSPPARGGRRRHYLTWSRRLIPAQGYEALQ